MAQLPSGLAGLTSFLENSISCSRTGRIQFPDHLIDSLAQAQFPIDSRSIRTVISIVEKTPTLYQTLHAASLRCLACVLLGSTTSSDQEHGLRLLLHDSADIESPETRPLSTKGSQLVQRKLAAALCSVFLDENGDLGLRKLAGKLLLETVPELECVGKPFSEELECLYPRIVSVFCRHDDTVLRFFAGAVLQSVGGSAVNRDAVWVPENAEYRPIFFKFLQKYPDDWLKSFYFYTREFERQNTQFSCFSIRHFGLDTVFYADRFMLATTTSDMIAFIIPASKSSRQCYQLIELPLRHISQSSPRRMENERYELRMRLDETGIFLTNGNQQQSSGAIVCLTSDEDLTGIWAQGQYTGNQIRGQPETRKSARRRPSSVLIPLDTSDEVAEKSGQYLEHTPHMGESMAETGHGRQAIRSREVPNVAAGSLTADEEPLANQSSGITSHNEDKRTLQVTDPDTSFLGLSALAHENPVPTGIAANETSFTGGTTDTPGVCSIEQKTSVMMPACPGKSPERLRMKETKKSSQTSMSRAFAAHKNKVPTPNRQESLLFSRPRRAKRKVYTTPSNGAVDWDEDLRPSDEGEEAEAERDIDFTSVSSPFPSDSPALGRSVGTARKKRNSVPSRKKQAKGSKENSGKGKHKASRLRLHPRGSSANNEQSAKPAHEGQKSHDESNGGVHGSSAEEGAGYEVNAAEESVHHTPRSVLSTHESVSPCKSGGPFMEGQFDDGNLGAVRSLDPLSVASVCSDKVWGSSAIGSAHPESNWGDTAQSYNLDEGYITEIKSRRRAKKQQGRGNVLGKKLAAALLEAGSSPGGSSIENEESRGYVSPRNRKKKDQKEPRGGKDCVPSERQNSLDADTEQMPGDDGLATSHPEKVSGASASVEPASLTGRQANVPDNHSHEQENTRPSNQKRAAADDQENLPQKKRRADTFEAHFGSETLKAASQTQGILPLVDNVGDAFSSGNPDIESTSWVTTDDGASEGTQLADPDRVDSEATTAIDLSGTPTPDWYSVKRLPKATVDANGSPRLRSTRFLNGVLADENIPRRWQGQLAVAEETMLECTQQPGDGDYSDSDATEYYPVRVPTFRDRVRLYFGEDLVGQAQKALSEPESGSSTRDVEQGLSIAKRRRASPADISLEGEGARSVSTPASTSELDKELETKCGPAQVSLGSSMGNPLQLESELTRLPPLEGEDMASAWQTSLQTIRRSTDSILLNTNQDIMRHVQREREAINRVLELYVQGCHRVLDQLFQAQEERIAGYRQQMEAIQEHQAGLCRGLMRRLERTQGQQ